MKSDHYTIADLTDGHSDLSTARFFYVFSWIESSDTTATEDWLKLKGSVTFEGGTYSIIENSLIKTFSDTTKSFDLTANMSLGADYINYKPADGANNTIRFFGEAETGLAGTKVSWNFPTMPSLNGEETIKGFITTQEQLEKFVPYVELENADGKITGLKWRLVNSSDVSTPIAVTEHQIGIRIRVYDENDKRFYNGSIIWSEYPEQLIEGTVTFNEPVSDIFRVEVYMYIPDYLPGRHIWSFYNFKDVNLSLWVNHISTASLINGKSYYTNSAFSNLYISPRNTEGIAEAKYFNEDGRIKIPTGTYELKRDDNYKFETLRTVTLNVDTDFKLRLESVTDFGERWISYSKNT